jgi:hydrogenase maturation protease
LILVDAAPRGEAPGTVFVIEPEIERGGGRVGLDAHGMDPEKVLGILAHLGGTPPRVLIVGCEPAEVEERLGLSPPVARAVGEAARVVRGLVEAEREV